MKIKELIAQIHASMAARLSKRTEHRETIDKIYDACAAEENRDPTDAEKAAITAARAEIDKIDAELEEQQARVKDLEAQQKRDDAADALSREVNPTGAGRPAHDRVHRVGQEQRTYREDEDPKGVRFLSDVVAQFLRNDPLASDRLSRHMTEERTERGEQIDRAAGTGALSGLVVPQYLTDLYAPLARAGRPFADACRHHDLPETGMVANISRITTGTSADVQANEGDAVSETNIDDTLLSVPVQTAAGQQTLSRQAIERGVGVEDTTMEDLFSAHATVLDNKLLNQATTGLTNIATAIAYTDASPTGPELYPKLLAAPAAAEAALLNQMIADLFATMHSRRWYWLQSQMTSTWPLFGQPGIGAYNAGVNYGEAYGSGFRGLLPSGMPVIVDNNIGTAYGAGTNEDEVYVSSKSECHLWEDPKAPMLIRAEQPKAANLQVLLVVYSYFAWTAARRPHAQKIGGTGLVTPTF